MKNIKNYIFVLLAILYFAMFFAMKNWYIFSDFALNIKSFFSNNDFEYYVWILNWIIWIILYYYLFCIVEKKVDQILKKTSSKINLKYHTIIWNMFVKFTDIIRYISTIYVWINLIVIPEKYTYIITNLLNFAFLSSFLILITTFINSIFLQLEKNYKKDETTTHIFPILNKFLIIFVWIIWVIMILSNLWYNVSALITWAWVWWVAIALASQKSVANIFWALNIILNRPFRIWDKIKIWAYSWIVKDIWIIYLKLESDDKTQILIPNETIITATIENLSAKYTK